MESSKDDTGSSVAEYTAGPWRPALSTLELRTNTAPGSSCSSAATATEACASSTMVLDGSSAKDTGWLGACTEGMVVNSAEAASTSNAGISDGAGVVEAAEGAVSQTETDRDWGGEQVGRGGAGVSVLGRSMHSEGERRRTAVMVGINTKEPLGEM